MSVTFVDDENLIWLEETTSLPVATNANAYVAALSPEDFISVGPRIGSLNIGKSASDQDAEFVPISTYATLIYIFEITSERIAEKKYAIRNTPLEEKIRNNEMKLLSFLDLNEGWNAGSGLPVPYAVINKAIYIMRKLSMQPEVFPTGRESVQFEYADNGRELEIEIFENEIAFLLTESDDIEKEWFTTDLQKILTTVEHFYAATPK